MSSQTIPPNLNARAFVGLRDQQKETHFREPRISLVGEEFQQGLTARENSHAERTNYIKRCELNYEASSNVKNTNKILKTKGIRRSHAFVGLLDRQRETRILLVGNESLQGLGLA